MSDTGWVFQVIVFEDEGTEQTMLPLRTPDGEISVFESKKDAEAAAFAYALSFNNNDADGIRFTQTMEGHLRLIAPEDPLRQPAVFSADAILDD